MKTRNSIWAAALLAAMLAGSAVKPAGAQQLDVPVVFQEMSQWCWAAVSQSMLAFQGVEVQQCEIAEYTRTTATWHNFGSNHCCNRSCNHWNYLQGTPGSIEDILWHFGNLFTDFQFSALSLPETEAEIKGKRPFVIRWGWTGGGGHFLVGTGLAGTMVTYMDPMHGSVIATHSYVVEGPSHKWTSTLKLDRSTGNHSPFAGGNTRQEDLQLHPNPARDRVRLSAGGPDGTPFRMVLYNLSGLPVRTYGPADGPSGEWVLDVSGLHPGLYLLSLTDAQGCRTARLVVGGT
jgi:hypothetical protein